MIYLIWGSPRSGKTILAKKLSKTLDIPYISTDYLRLVVMSYFKNEDKNINFPFEKMFNIAWGIDNFFKNYSWKELLKADIKESETLWSGIESFIKHLLFSKTNYIIEGIHFLPKLIKKYKDDKNFKIIILTKIIDDKIFNGLLQNRNTWDWIADNIKDDKILLSAAKSLSEYGKYFIKESKKYEFMFINTEDNFHDKIEKANNYLKNLMNKQELNNFIDNIRKVMYFAWEIAIKKQNTVKNIWKYTDELLFDNDYTKQRRSAKTLIDEEIQEIILKASAKLLNLDIVSVDAEENTPSKNLFSTKQTSTTLIIDPIDWTLEYISGKDSYRICVWIVENWVILTSLIYFPARKEFYFIRDENVYCEKNNILQKLSKPKKINKTNIYVNNRVSSEIISKLKKEWFSITDDSNGIVNWCDALIQCIKGEFTTCIFHTPQIRDILLGAMINTLQDGYVNDLKGNKIIWPQSWRIQNVLFWFNQISDKIINSLN